MPRWETFHSYTIIHYTLPNRLFNIRCVFILFISDLPFSSYFHEEKNKRRKNLINRRKLEFLKNLSMLMVKKSATGDYESNINDSYTHEGSYIEGGPVIYPNLINKRIYF